MIWSPASSAREGPDRLWVADITQHRAPDGWVYTAVVIDAWSRMVVGWSIADHLRSELVVDALDMAIWRRRPVAEVIHHADHGCQYTSWAFGQRLRAAGLLGSMGSVGDALDNAVAESFFATLQTELLDRQPWTSRRATGSSHLRVDRGVLQPDPASLHGGHAQPGRLRQNPPQPDCGMTLDITTNPSGKPGATPRRTPAATTPPPPPPRPTTPPPWSAAGGATAAAAPTDAAGRANAGPRPDPAQPQGPPHEPAGQRERP